MGRHRRGGRRRYILEQPRCIGNRCSLIGILNTMVSGLYTREKDSDLHLFDHPNGDQAPFAELT